MLLHRLALGIFHEWKVRLIVLYPFIPTWHFVFPPPESSFLVVFALFRVLQRQAGQAPSKKRQAGDAHFSGKTTGLLPRDDCAFPQTLSRCFRVSREVLWVHKIHKNFQRISARYFAFSTCFESITSPPCFAFFTHKLRKTIQKTQTVSDPYTFPAFLGKQTRGAPRGAQWILGQ